MPSISTIWYRRHRQVRIGKAPPRERTRVLFGTTVPWKVLRDGERGKVTGNECGGMRKGEEEEEKEEEEARRGDKIVPDLAGSQRRRRRPPA